jgi:ABC-type glycerol-3-phosphate transport system permease component
MPVQRLSWYMQAARVLGYLLLVIAALTMVVPFVWMITTSLKLSGSEFAYPPELFPREFHFENYAKLFVLVPFLRYFLNTLIVTFAVVMGQLVICSMAAYAFSRLTFIGRNTLFLLYLATMMIPWQITLIPLFLIVYKLGWVNTYVGLIVPSLSNVFGIFLLRQAFLGTPGEYQEAARVDGASEWLIYRRLFLPLNKAAMTTLGVFTFMGSWTDLLWPVLMSRSQTMRTLEVGLAYFNSSVSTFKQTNWPIMMSAAVVVMLPVLIVYFLTQRFFVEGISMTGLKG